MPNLAEKKKETLEEKDSCPERNLSSSWKLRKGVVAGETE